MAFLPSIKPSQETHHEDSDRPPSPVGALGVLEGCIRRVRFHQPEEGAFILEIDATQAPSVPQALAQSMSRHVVVKGAARLMQGIGKDDLERRWKTCPLQFHGVWGVDPRHGLQFEAHLTQPARLDRLANLLAYIKSGHLPHVGPRIAERMVARWGEQLLEVLNGDPALLAEVPGLTAARAAKIQAAWQAQRAWFDLVSFLGVNGLSERKTMQAATALNADGLEARIRADPYILMDVEGIGFQTADRVAINLGWGFDSPERITAIVLHLLTEAVQREGHTVLPIEVLRKKASALAGLDAGRVDECLLRLQQDRRIDLVQTRAADQTAPTLWVGPRRLMDQETAIATLLADRLRLDSHAFQPGSLSRARAILEEPQRNLDASQQAAAQVLLQHRVAVLTGGPGTGKTTTLRALSAVWDAWGKTVVWAAPTGKAAQRMTEAIGAPASTMHRLLKWGRPELETRDLQLAGDVFVVDEASMVDVPLLARWLRALPSTAQVILVGDADQLPPVGPGNTFRDIIRSGTVPVARLTEVHRTRAGSLINLAAKDIRENRIPRLPSSPWEADASLIDSPDNTALAATVMSLLRALRQRGVPVHDLAVLTAQNEGEVGIQGLNAAIRDLLNPPPDGPPDPPEDDPFEEVFGASPETDAPVRPPPTLFPLPFRTGDRVIQTRNNNELGWYNGETGTVTAVTDRDLAVRLDSGSEVRVTREESRTLRWGYAMTIHKSQGSEWPVVILVCSHSHHHTINRDLLYTGFTRGRQQVVVVGQARAWHAGIKKISTAARTTLLAGHLRRAVRRAPAPPVDKTTTAPHPERG